jgi:hypothetical protein
VKYINDPQQVKYLDGFFIFHEIGKYGAEVIGFEAFSKIFDGNVSDIWTDAIKEIQDGLAVLVAFPTLQHDHRIRPSRYRIANDETSTFSTTPHATSPTPNPASLM